MTAGLTSALSFSPPGAKKIFSNVDTGIHMRASAARTNLLDIGTAAGGSLFKVDKAGCITVSSGSASAAAVRFGSSAEGIYQINNGFAVSILSNTPVFAARYVGPGENTYGIGLVQNAFIGWGSQFNATTGHDLLLGRDAAGILALKNGANPQTFRIYGNTTGSKYLQLTHDGTNAKITASSGNVHISNLPTSNPGPGILWNNGGVPAIGT